MAASLDRTEDVIRACQHRPATHRAWQIRGLPESFHHAVFQRQSNAGIVFIQLNDFSERKDPACRPGIAGGQPEADVHMQDGLVLAATHANLRLGHPSAVSRLWWRYRGDIGMRTLPATQN